MHYVIGDIHRQICTLQRLLKKLNLQPEDKVYFVGDWFDRAYTEEEAAETTRWMLENLTVDSQFRSVIGNHDLDQLEHICYYMQNNDEIARLTYLFFPEYIKQCYPELKQLLENMPLYESFTVNDEEFLVTHSWLIDNSGNAIGSEEFDIHNLNVTESVWDRDFSLKNFKYSNEMPTIIHGHTPTLGKHDIWADGCQALAKIHKITEKNINVDCCAFYSPLRGGNLAAYRCEDGAEFYAYEDEIFYQLVDDFFEEMTYCTAGITWEEWYFAVLFHGQHQIFHPKESRVLNCENEKIKRVYDKYRKIFNYHDNDVDFSFEIERIERRLNKRLHEIVPEYWKTYLHCEFSGPIDDLSTYRKNLSSFMDILKEIL